MSESCLGTVVVPVLNEAQGLEYWLADLLVKLENRWQVVVCDGGSVDNTRALLARFPVTVVVSESGRARQMNAGAAVSAGPLLVFLHADTWLPESFNLQMQQFLSGHGLWGRFNVALDHPGRAYSVISWFINRRSALTGVCTGDQTLFMRAEFFHQLQGFTDYPLMEDVDFSLRARKFQATVCFKGPVITSARRWTKHGVVRTVLLMWWLRLAFRVGVSPQRLHQWYYR